MRRQAGMGVSGRLVLLLEAFLFALLRPGTLLILSYIPLTIYKYRTEPYERTIAKRAKSCP